MVSTGSISNILKQIQQNIENALKQTNLTQKVQLVAVSKTKPVEQIQEVYNEGHRHFGENYVDEIAQKHSLLPNDIKWHFIGHLQSNKIKQVCVPNLYMIETIDSIKLAQKLDKHLSQENRNLNVILYKIMDIQSVYRFLYRLKRATKIQSMAYLQRILQNQLTIQQRLMTIGQQGDLSAFDQMYKLKKTVCEKFGISLENCELSMGMSGDYEQAILNGSTNIRVGSTIFGARNYNKPEKTDNVDKQTENADKQTELNQNMQQLNINEENKQN